MTQGSGTEDEDQLREIREAQDACEAALTSLGEAQRAVDSAQSWGTYDTWFGGGLFSSLMKHDRIDDAEGYMRAVDAALDRLRRELADVRMEGAALGGSASATSTARSTCGSTTSSPTWRCSPGSTTRTTGSTRSARPWCRCGVRCTTVGWSSSAARTGPDRRTRAGDCVPD